MWPHQQNAGSHRTLRYVALYCIALVAAERLAGKSCRFQRRQQAQTPRTPRCSYTPVLNILKCTEKVAGSPPEGWPADLPAPEETAGVDAKDADEVAEATGAYAAAALFSASWQLREAGALWLERCLLPAVRHP